MNELRVSLFGHSRDASPKPVTTTWEEFAAGLGPHRTDISKKLDVPMFCPAEFRPGMPRVAKHALRVWFGVLDLDKCNADQMLSLACLLEGLDAVLYTTWSHPETYSRGLWRVRVCVRLTRPVEANDWPSFWLAFTRHFGGLNDPQCKDISRCYFAPAVPPGTHPSLYSYVVFSGIPFDVDTLGVSSFEHTPTPGGERVSRDRLARIAHRWRRSRDVYRAEMGEVLDKIVKGEPYAEPGNRDNVLFQLCSDLAKALPDANAESIAEHFAQSLQVCGTNLQVDIEKVRDKFTRAQEKVLAESYANDLIAVSERKLRIRQAFAHIDPSRETPYTEEELSVMAAACKCTRDELRKRWIIQRGPIYYVLGPEGVYSPPYTDKDVWNALLRDLAPADSAGVDLWSLSPGGEKVRKPLPVIMSEYGSVATDSVLDMRAQIASYDGVQRLFTEAPCPLRDLAPTYDSDVATWLELLTGEHHANVLNWIAHITDLDVTCAALMLTGKKDTGKSLLATGLSRLWTLNGPTPLSSALADFNDKLAKCPLVFADEQLPKDFRGHGRTAEIREFLSARARPFKKKFFPEATILGAIRLLVAANNENILAIQEHLSAFDIEAIGDRFYHIPVNPVAADWLALCDTQSFIAHDRIAKHALWLRDNHPKTRNGRFIIKSENREFYRGLATQSGIRSAICQWLVGYCKNPRPIDSRGDFGVLIKRGRLYATPGAVLDSWDLYVKNEPAPNLGRLAQGIAELSVRRTRLSKPRGTGIAHYREIDTDHLYAWIERTEYLTREDLDSVLGCDTETRLSGTK